jgi:hypothetical protein
MLIAVVAVWLKVGDSLSTKRLGVHVGAIIIPYISGLSAISSWGSAPISRAVVVPSSS